MFQHVLSALLDLLCLCAWVDLWVACASQSKSILQNNHALFDNQTWSCYLIWTILPFLWWLSKLAHFINAYTLAPKMAPAQFRPWARFFPRAGTGMCTSPFWHRANLGHPVLEEGTPFWNWANFLPNPRPKCNTNCMKPIWGCTHPSSSMGQKIRPSAGTGLVPILGPTYITYI
jgi:hypothetical protein